MGLNGETMWGVKSLRIFLNVRIIFLYKKRQLLIYSYLTFSVLVTLLSGWNASTDNPLIRILFFIVISYFYGIPFQGFRMFDEISILIKMF